MNISKNNWMTWIIRANFVKSNRSAYEHDEMPKSLCSFWWTFILCLVIQVVNWPGLVLAAVRKDFRENPGSFAKDKGFGHPVFNVFWQIVGVAVMAGVFKLFGIEKLDSAIHLLWIIPAGMILLAGALVGLGYLGGFVMEYFEDRKFGKRNYGLGNKPDFHNKKGKEEYNKWWTEYNKREAAAKSKKEQSFRYIASQWFKSNKDKVCPVITYGNQEPQS